MGELIRIARILRGPATGLECANLRNLGPERRRFHSLLRGDRNEQEELVQLEGDEGNYQEQS